MLGLSLKNTKCRLPKKFHNNVKGIGIIFEINKLTFKK